MRIQIPITAKTPGENMSHPRHYSPSPHPNVFLAACVLLMASSCASSGGTPPNAPVQVGASARSDYHEIVPVIESGATSVIQASVADVWQAASEVYTDLGIEVAHSDPQNRKVGNPSYRAPRRIGGDRLSQFIDCGYGATAIPNADQYQITMSLMTDVWAAEGGGSNLRTTISSTGRPRNVTSNPINCGTKGTLETRIATLVKAKLAGN